MDESEFIEDAMTEARNLANDFLGKAEVARRDAEKLTLKADWYLTEGYAIKRMLDAWESRLSEECK